MVILPVFAVLFAAPTWGAGEIETAFLAARRAVMAAAVERLTRRDEILGRWISGSAGSLWDDETAERVFVLCGGEIEGAILTLRVGPGKALNDILCHELAHAFHRAQPARVDHYLALRARTAAMRQARGRILALTPPLPPPGRPSLPLPQKARRLLKEASVPRRHEDDVHALRTDGEYWAVSVELACMARGDPKSLNGLLSREETLFLRDLMDSGDYRARRRLTKPVVE